jgi:1-acyl-sn-glycerol-3-phosphate acyltransferase
MPSGTATTEARAPARLLREAFFLGVVRPLVAVVLGVNLRHRERLPMEGPAILLANHNSHLDALTLMALLPHRLLPRIRPVAALDYFLKTRWLAWFATRVIGIIPLDRLPKPGSDPLAEPEAALARGDILILFPEGSRGEPEQLQAFRTGIAHLAKRRPEVPVIPVFLHGLGKALPKDAFLLVPFFVDVFVGEPVPWTGGRADFMARLERAMHALAEECRAPAWE